MNREREVENIAKEIKYLLTDKNIKPNNICVVFNLIQNYSALIRDIFTLYGLPFNLTDRYSLKTSAPVIAVINFLEILENDFYYKNIFRALSSGYLNFGGIEQSTLLKASINLKLISGYENWRGSLRDAIKRSESTDEESSSVILDKEIYKKALNDIETLAEHLKPFRGQYTLAQFRTNLIDLIFTINLPGILINNKSTAVEENIKAVNTFLEEVNEVFELLEMEFDKEQKFPLTFFMNSLRTIISSSRYNIKERPGFGIQVTNLNEIRGLKFDYLFISGLSDGDLPTRYTPEIFFSGSYARNERVHQTEERHLFYQSLSSWNKHLYLTYPVQEERKELVKSSFLNDLQSLFEVTLKNGDLYPDTIYSREDFYIHIGRIGIDKAFKHYSDYFKNNELDQIAGTLKINDIRINDPFGESEFTGFIKNNLSDKANDSLLEYAEKVYSVTQLETYAKCPFKYFGERVLRLKPLSEPSEDIEALEMGSLLHLILYKFYSEVKARNIVLPQASFDELKESEELLFKIAEESIESAGFSSPLNFFEKEKILGINGQRTNSILYKFLDSEKENKDGFIPEYFEKSFGNPSVKDNETTVIKAGSAELTGKIDRIDVKEDENKYKVIDYKLSGKKPSLKDMGEGLSLQLPLYLYAAGEILKKNLERKHLPAGAEIYSLKYDKDNFGKKIATNWSRKKISNKEKEDEAIKDNLELIDLCLEKIEKYVKDIAGGKFNLTLLPNREKVICGYCDFKPVCRIQEVE